MVFKDRLNRLLYVIFLNLNSILLKNSKFILNYINKLLYLPLDLNEKQSSYPFINNNTKPNVLIMLIKV